MMSLWNQKQSRVYDHRSMAQSDAGPQAEAYGKLPEDEKKQANRFFPSTSGRNAALPNHVRLLITRTESS